DAGAARQRGDLDGGAGRLVGAEALLVDGVELGEVAEVGDEDGRLHHPVEARSGLGEDGGEVVEDLLGLRLDALGQVALEVERDLARGEEEAVDLDGVDVGADGGGGAGGVDGLHAWASFGWWVERVAGAV